jgi:hypothetical protein
MHIALWAIGSKLCLWAIAALLQFPHVGKYSAAKTDGYPYVLPDGNLDSTLCKLQARYDYVIIDGGSCSRYPQFPRYLRTLNPSIKLIAYFNASVTGDWGGYAQNEYQAIVQTGGFLYCYGLGTTKHICYDWFNINLGKVSTQVAHADTIVNIMRRSTFEGILLDVWPPNMKGTTTLSPRDTLDWQRMGYTSYNDFWANWNAGSWVLGSRVREALGIDFPIIGNYGPYGFRDICAGWMRENFPYQNGGTWYTNMVRYVTPAWTDSGYLSDDRL